jgi:hypothetical protein
MFNSKYIRFKNAYYILMSFLSNLKTALIVLYINHRKYAEQNTYTHDFKIESLMLLRYAASGDQYKDLDIIFLHCKHLSDSITDPMFYFPSKIIQEAFTPEL